MLGLKLNDVNKRGYWSIADPLYIGHSETQFCRFGPNNKICFDKNVFEFENVYGQISVILIRTQCVKSLVYSAKSPYCHILLPTSVNISHFIAPPLRFTVDTYLSPGYTLKNTSFISSFSETPKSAKCLNKLFMWCCWDGHVIHNL